MPILDATLMLRTTGNLTQSESNGPVTLWGGDKDGAAFRTVVPSANGANDTVWPKVYYSTDGSTYRLIAQNPKGAQTIPSGGRVFITPFPLFVGKGYYKQELVVTVASTTVNFGAVTAGYVDNPGFEWDRSADALMH